MNSDGKVCVPEIRVRGGEAAAARPIKIPGRVGLGGLLLSPFPFPFPSFPAGGSPAAGCKNQLLLSI